MDDFKFNTFDYRQINKYVEFYFKVNESVQNMKAAGGIILASPVYYSGVAGMMKCFSDRAFYVAGVNGGLFKHKIGAAVSAQRRTGGSSTLDCLNHYFIIFEIPVASSTYWNAIHGMRLTTL